VLARGDNTGCTLAGSLLPCTPVDPGTRMHVEFWHTRWKEGRIGWHQAAVDRQLARHWPTLELPATTRVLVPLCGKSLDMAWLAARGHRVIGVELAEQACRTFFAEQGLTPEETTHAGFLRLAAGGIELWCGDLFALPSAFYEGIDAVYDRAALIALPPSMRAAYADAVYGALPAGCRGLLITLEYPDGSRDGPPFCVREPEVRTLLRGWRVDCMAREALDADDPLQAGNPGLRESVAWELARG
jgi:thiopurine S-methyltransferase